LREEALLEFLAEEVFAEELFDGVAGADCLAGWVSPEEVEATTLPDFFGVEV